MRIEKEEWEEKEEGVEAKGRDGLYVKVWEGEGREDAEGGR